MLERASSQPLYSQARDVLLSRLNAGEYKVHEQIPSENELCKEFGVSRVTIRSVLTELVREGWLYRIQGKGTYVAEPKFTASSTSYVGIREQLEQQGYDVATSVIVSEIIECPVEIAKTLALDIGAQVYHIRRLRTVKGAPFSIHDSYIPAALCEGLEQHDFCHTQLCTILSQNYHLVRAHVSEFLESTSALAEEAELLHVRRGYPLLRLCDVISDQTGCVFEYSTVYFPGDRIQIKLQYDL